MSAKPWRRAGDLTTIWVLRGRPWHFVPPPGETYHFSNAIEESSRSAMPCTPNGQADGLLGDPEIFFGGRRISDARCEEALAKLWLNQEQHRSTIVLHVTAEDC